MREMAHHLLLGVTMSNGCKFPCARASQPGADAFSLLRIRLGALISKCQRHVRLLSGSRTGLTPTNSSNTPSSPSGSEFHQTGVVREWCPNEPLALLSGRCDTKKTDISYVDTIAFLFNEIGSSRPPRGTGRPPAQAPLPGKPRRGSLPPSTPAPHGPSAPPWS